MRDDSSRPGRPGRRRTWRARARSRWSWRRWSWRRDVAVVVAVFVLGTAVSVWLELFEAFHAWSHEHGLHRAEELAAGLFLTIAAVGALSWRRYRLARADAIRLESAERELALANERFGSLFDYHPQAVYSMDVEGRFTSANAAAQRLTGRSEEELRQLPGFGLLLAPESSGDVGDAFARVLAKEAVYVECAILRSSGERVELGITGLPIVVDGEVVGGYGIAEDITDRTRMQRELGGARRSAEQASEAKSLFLANMGHEIRTPLTSIMAVTELLSDDPCLHPSQRHFVDMMERNGQRLLRLVDDILDFSRIERGQVDLEATLLDLHELVSDCVECYRRDADSRGLVLHAATAERLPSRLVGDAGRIRQVLGNLVGNAVKFTETGGVTVLVDVTGTQDGCTTVLILVEDTGIGMTEEQVAGLFDSFSQADPSITRKYGGTGLGLALCHQLVTLMDGTIEVASVPGEGSTFSVTLPLKHPALAST